MICKAENKNVAYKCDKKAGGNSGMGPHNKKHNPPPKEENLEESQSKTTMDHYIVKDLNPKLKSILTQAFQVFQNILNILTVY